MGESKVILWDFQQPEGQYPNSHILQGQPYLSSARYVPREHLNKEVVTKCSPLVLFVVSTQRIKKGSLLLNFAYNLTTSGSSWSYSCMKLLDTLSWFYLLHYVSYVWSYVSSWYYVVLAYLLFHQLFLITLFSSWLFS